MRNFFNKELYDFVNNNYPINVALPYHKVYTSANVNERLAAFASCINDYLNFIFHVLSVNFINDYAEVETSQIENYDTFKSIKQDIRAFFIGRYSLGTVHGINRNILQHYADSSHTDWLFLRELSEFYGINAKKGRATSMDRCITLRNRFAHPEGKLEGEKLQELYEESVEALGFLYEDSRFWEKYLLFVPVRKIEPENLYDIKHLTGNTFPYVVESNRLFGQELTLNRVYLLRNDGEILPVHPLLQFSNSKNDKQDKIFFVTSKTKGKSLAVSLESVHGGETQSCDNRDVSEFINKISLDYNYQRDPWKQGHSLIVEDYTIVFDIHNNRGDLTTTHDIRLRKIMDDTASPDYLPMDYHDAPVFVIPEEIFNLKVHRVKKVNRTEVCEDVTDELVDWKIKEDGYKEFGLKFDPPLEFDELRNYRITFFEPEYVSGIKYGNDYYEYMFEVPTDKAELKFILPTTLKADKVEFTDFTTEEDVTGKRCSCEIISGDRDIFSFKFKKPEVRRNFMLRFYVRKVGEDEVVSPSLDKYWASKKAYEKVFRSSHKNFVFVNLENEMVILPVRGEWEWPMDTGIQKTDELNASIADVERLGLTFLNDDKIVAWENDAGWDELFVLLKQATEKPVVYLVRAAAVLYRRITGSGCHCFVNPSEWVEFSRSEGKSKLVWAVTVEGFESPTENSVVSCEKTFILRSKTGSLPAIDNFGSLHYIEPLKND